MPWGSPAGAPRRDTPRSGKVEGGCAVRLSFSLIEILVELIVVSLAFIGFYGNLGGTGVVFRKVWSDMNSFIDLSMAVTFIRDEIYTRITEPTFTSSSTRHISYMGLSNGEVKEIEYSIRKVRGVYRIYRRARGEGSNVVYESKEPIWFEIKGRLVILHVEGYEFYLHEPKKLDFSGFPGVSLYPLPSRGR